MAPPFRIPWVGGLLLAALVRVGSVVAADVAPANISNLSGRALAGKGDAVLVAGFVITGDAPLPVAIRSMGPGLTRFGVTNVASDPRVSVFAGDKQVGENDDWILSTSRSQIEGAGVKPPDGRDAVFFASLAPGAYTAVVQDKGGGGVCTAEVFDLGNGGASRLVNVSIRSTVGEADAAVIAGFVLVRPTTVVVRALGASLRRFGVESAAGDTTLKIVRQADNLTVFENNNWDAPENFRLKSDLAGYRPLDSQEAAAVVTLPAGAYSAVVGPNGGAPGVGLVEVYQIDSTAAYTAWQLALQHAGFPARDSAAHVVFQDKLWLFGGWTPARSNDIWSSSDGFVWNKEADAAPWAGRNLASVVVHEGKLFLFAGATRDGNEVLRDVWTSVDGRNWSLLSDSAPWPARSAATAVSQGGRIWLMGGMTSVGRDPSNVHFGDVWLSRDGISWEAASQKAPWGPRAMHSSVVFADKVWVIGGGLYSDFTTNFSDAWSSSDGKYWTQELERGPWANRRFQKSIVFDDRIWIVGGVHYGDVPPYNLNDVWVSRDGRSWLPQVIQAGWSFRHEMGLFAIKGRLWIVGGGGEQDAVYNDVWFFQP